MQLTGNNYKKILKLLKLDRPLVIFDVETTGLNLHSDKIVELAYTKINENGRVKKEDMLLDPEFKISLEAIAVHGIRNRDVREKPKFRDKAQELWDIFYDCYYSGFNIINFDLPLLRREFIRCGMDFEYSVDRIIDSREIFQKMVPRTLSSTYEYYTKKKLVHWHTAQNDVESATEILVHQLEKYKEVRDWEFINLIHRDDAESFLDSTRKFYWLKGEAYFAFSKYNNRRLKDIAVEDQKFLEWILSADFSEEAKNVVRKALGENDKKSSLVGKLKLKK